MNEIRTIGNRIQQLAEKKNITVERLSTILKQPEEKMILALYGRAMFSYSQLEKLAELFGVSVAELINTTESDCSSYAVDCMNNFTKTENMNEVLDLIYDYLDIVDSVEKMI